MLKQKENGYPANNSNGQATAQAPKQPHDLIQIVDDFFRGGGSSDPVETINFHLCEFILNKDKTKWDDLFVANTVFESARIVNFITKLHELRKGAY